MLDEAGVLPDSVRYYHEADPFTAEHLFWVPHAGVYHCSRAYEVRRASLDAYLMLLVDEGALAVEYSGQTQTAHAGAVVLLDRRRPHRYYAATDILRMRWFHFYGAGSGAYTAHILQTHGFVLSAVQNAQIEPCFTQIMAAVRQGQPHPHRLSVAIHTLLALLAEQAEQRDKSGVEQAVQASADFLDQHFAEKELTIEHLARMCALSTCYYLRKFKEFQSITPHQYLLAARLRAAKQQLTTTSRSIEEIASRCGFCNTSHFVMAFRKDTGMTPLRFRTLWK